MTVTVVVQLKAMPENVDELKVLWREVIDETRAYDGCNSIFIYENQDAPGRFALIENWDSRDHYDKYLAWRTETGFVDKVVALVEGDLDFGFFDKTDI